MSFHLPDPVPVKSPGPGVNALQIEDLNTLIDSLKRREENIIQLLDYNLKFKASGTHMDTVHLRGLYAQLTEREKKRIELEEQVIQKYVDLYVNDDYHKKLMNKMTNKILQLSSSARDKLIQLGIFQQIKEAFLGISTFEELIGSVLAQVPIDVHFFLNCLIDHSRKRFFDKIDQNPDMELEPYRNKALEMPQFFPKSELNLVKVTSQKGVSPQVSAKFAEEPKLRESVRIRNLEPNSVLYRKDFIKVGRSPLVGKSVDSRSSFEGREKINDDLQTQEKTGPTGALNEIAKSPELFSINEPAYQSLNAIKDTPTREISLRQEVLALTLNLNSPNVNSEKAVGSVQSNNSSRFSNVKKVKITSTSSSIKKSLCLEEPTEPQQTDKDKEKKDKPNKEAWLKNYDILKIEYTPLPTATKKETKKLLLEKVYKELWSTNTDIKRTMKRYRTSYLAYSQKKQSEDDTQKEETNKNSNNNSNIVETNRPKSLTPHSYANIPPAKPKASAVHSNHRNLLSIENPKDITEDIIDPNSEHFVNILNHFSGSLSSKQNKDFNKKNASQKFLVLPKLNLNADSQSQGIFPCWPPVLQGSKSAAKSNFTIDFGNRARFEKSQKGSERLVHHLLLDTKQDMSDQETLNTSLANAPTINTNPRVYSNFANRNSYPLTLQPIDAVSTVNNKPLVL